MSKCAVINLEIWDDGPKAHQPKFHGAIRPGVWGPRRPPLGSRGKASRPKTNLSISWHLLVVF